MSRPTIAMQGKAHHAIELTQLLWKSRRYLENQGYLRQPFL